MPKALRRWLGLGAGAIVLGLIFYRFRRSAEWQGFDWGRLWSSLAQARPGLMLTALVASSSSYLLRAYRWGCFLNPLKKASLWVLFAGQILGFSSIYLIGRPGEFVRPAYIAKKENVPIASMLAVWFLERTYDTISLVLLFAAALYVAPVDPTTAKGRSVLVAMHRGGGVLFLATSLLVAALVAFRLRAEEFTAGVLRMVPFLPVRVRLRLEHLLASFAYGLEVIRSWKDFLRSIASTIVLWVVNASVFWLVFQSLGGDLERLPWLAAGMVTFFAALGLVVQFPGLGGGYQVGALVALTEIYNVRAEAATGAAIMVWIMVAAPCLALGLAILSYEGLTFKKLEAIAEEERAAAIGKV
jgi:uncharacterized protein (TIRG00374 family)